MSKEEIFEYVQKQYGTLPEYLWSKSPDSAVLRHKNGKWYAVIMKVEKSKLGLDGDDAVDILDVKCDPEMTGMIIQTYGFLPGYHMNKQHWIRQNKYDGYYYDVNNELIAFDTDLTNQKAGLIIRKDALDKFLKLKKFHLVWFVNASKEIHDESLRITKFKDWTGLLEYTGDSIQGEYYIVES